MAVREASASRATITSDTAALWPLVRRLRTRAAGHVHVLRDPTRGGVASALNEIAAASRRGHGARRGEHAGAARRDGGVRDARASIRCTWPTRACCVAIVPGPNTPMPPWRRCARSRSAPTPCASGASWPSTRAWWCMRTHVGGTRVVDMLPGRPAAADLLVGDGCNRDDSNNKIEPPRTPSSPRGHRVSPLANLAFLAVQSCCCRSTQTISSSPEPRPAPPPHQ